MALLPDFAGFLGCSGRQKGAAEFASPAALACLFVLRTVPRMPKSQAKSRLCIWPAACVCRSEQNFFAAILIGYSVRASATSKIASSAGIPPAQSKANAGKTDQASPFALLMDSMASKDSVKDSGKPPQKNASNSGGRDDKSAATNANPSNANPADQQGGQADNAANTIMQGQKSASNSKTGKQDQPDDKDEKTKAADGTADADQTSVLQLLESQAQPAQPAQPAAQPFVQTAAAPANDDDSGDMPVGNVGATAPAPATPVTPVAPDIAQDAAAPTTPALKPSDLAAAQLPPASEDDEDNQTEDAPPTQPVAAQSAPQVSSPAKPAPKSAAVKAAAAEKPSVSADTQIASADSAKSDAVKDNQAPKPDGRQDTAKDDAVKPGESAKGQTGQAAGTKADANKYAIGKTGPDNSNDTDAKTAAAAPQVQPAEIPDTMPKAAPHPAPTAVFAVNNIAASQAALNSPVAQAAGQTNVTQHIQVSAQAAPNLPALAVEIAAKSQSGSKQFDIRLDPPELGRVDVRLSIDATGKASAHLSADQPQTLTLLQKDAPALTRALRDAGLDVSQDGLNFSLRQQADNSNGNAAGSNRRGGSARNFSLTATTSIEPSAATAAYRGLANERLDIRV